MPPKIAYKPPDYMDPSVTDSWWTWAKRQVGTLLGADDPAGQVMGMVGALEVPAAKVARQVAKQAIKAYHGSPHDFERFDLSKIGTGEGGQAYGHGLYFAENPETAKAYRDRLSASPQNARPFHIEQIRGLAKSGVPVQEAREHILSGLRDQLDEARFNLRSAKAGGPRQTRNSINRVEVGKSEQDLVDALQRQITEVEAWPTDSILRDPGHMYEVNLNVSPDELLDWDKPLSEQSPKVREALAALPESEQLLATNPLLEASYRARGLPSQGVSGSSLYERLVAREGGRSGHTEGLASKALREKGIKGIQYLDAGSRAAGEGTKNFVIFDDSLISIARKYGIPLAVLSSPAGRAMLESLAKRDAQSYGQK